MKTTKKVVVTGACGFIGVCLCLRLLKQGMHVIGIDNLSRPGSQLNLAELSLAGGLFTFHKLDLADSSDVKELFASIGAVDAVFHLAGQVAVTASYLDRETDFKNNVVASFNVIESVKKYSSDAYCLYASTNKVYGNIAASDPVGRDVPLNPYTPYGVSKAAAELYFTEYGRKELGLSTCCLRQSCIYGHHQYGIEDQGWVAWFSIANIMGMPVTIYGDGLQVRDILFIDDLLDLYLECFAKRVTGVYPMGGGRANMINLQQALKLIVEITQKPFKNISYSCQRPGDQPFFVADTNWTHELGLSWAPQKSIAGGVRNMIAWIQHNEDLIKSTIKTP
jgi:CDP-paratose 2-epimerase